MQLVDRGEKMLHQRQAFCADQRPELPLAPHTEGGQSKEFLHTFRTQVFGLSRMCLLFTACLHGTDSLGSSVNPVGEHDVCTVHIEV